MRFIGKRRSLDWLSYRPLSIRAGLFEDPHSTWFSFGLTNKLWTACGVQRSRQHDSTVVTAIEIKKTFFVLHGSAKLTQINGTSVSGVKPRFFRCWGGMIQNSSDLLHIWSARTWNAKKNFYPQQKLWYSIYRYEFLIIEFPYLPLVASSVFEVEWNTELASNTVSDNQISKKSYRYIEYHNFSATDRKFSLRFKCVLTKYEEDRSYSDSYRPSNGIPLKNLGLTPLTFALSMYTILQ